MEIFSEIKSKVTETAKLAFEKSNDLVEITKLNMAIGDASSQIKALYLEIGTYLYENHKNSIVGLADGINSNCRKIDELSEKIDELKSKLSLLKKVRICSNCKNDSPLDSKFCSKCGNKFEPVPKDEKEEIDVDFEKNEAYKSGCCCDMEGCCSSKEDIDNGTDS